MRLTAFAAMLVLGLSGVGQAQDLMISGTNVSARIPGTFHATLSVAGPSGFYMKAFSRNGAVGLQLSAGGRLVDGVYRWEVTAATGQVVKVRDLSNPQRTRRHVGAARSGSFRVQAGAIVMAPIAKSLDRAN